jgi:uncharacterized protein YndB with AHSA1/START domain
MAKSITVEETYDAPIEKVWSAISNNEEFDKWFMKLGDFKPEVGHVFEFEAGSDDKKYLHKCKVLEVVPNKTLSYSWRYEGFPGESVVVFDLEDMGDGKTKLTLTHDGLDTFPQDIPDFASANFKEGWTSAAQELKGYVEGGTGK